MKTLIKAGVVYPVTSVAIRNGYVLISGGKIEEAGKQEEIHRLDFDKVIDLTGHILLPGFVNAHSHLQLSGVRGKVLYKGSFPDWVSEVIRYNAETASEERTAAMKEGIEEMRRSGITAVGDIVTSADYAEPLVNSLLDKVIFIEAIAPHEDEAEKKCRWLEGELEKLRRKGVAVGISPHSPHTVSRKLFGLLKQIADDKSLPMMVHVAETPEEEEFVRDGKGPLRELFQKRDVLTKNFNGFGLSPAALLNVCGVLEKVLAVHLNFAGEEDISLLSKQKTVPVFCPSSSRWFSRKRVMPLEKFLETGLRPAFGTDSLASNSSLSMLDELRTAADYFPRITRETFIEMATINGARALGMNAGAIEKGLVANLAAFRLTSSDDPLEAVFTASKADFVFASRLKIRKKVTTDDPDEYE